MNHLTRPHVSGDTGRSLKVLAAPRRICCEAGFFVLSFRPSCVCTSGTVNGGVGYPQGPGRASTR